MTAPRRSSAGRGCGGRPQQHGEDRALAGLARDVERPAVAADDVLDDGEAEPRPAHRARARRVDAVEALGEARQVLPRDALPAVLHRDRDARAATPALDKARRSEE